ncbi:MAG TPA: YidB family protein [Dehalococcoidia bacterium]|jgi:uncharacterized protein YidB (DUF937 family)|nr:YidB family protein [Dehalococcoidia bacterium]
MTNFIGKLFGGGGGNDNSALLRGLGETLGSGSGGGITGLIDKFDAAGMGDKARSWVGDGPHEQVSGPEVRRALGDQEIEHIAEKAGMPADKASDGLASILPDAVSQLTPGGKIPDTSELQQMLKKMPGM